MPEAVIPAADTMTEAASAFAADREAQFLEIAGELPDDGEEGPGAEEILATEAAPPATETPAEPVEGTATATEEEPDLLANAKPFDYTVDGQTKTYDGIKVLADKDGTVQGGIIPAESLKDVQYRLQRGEYLETQNKALYQQNQALDRITFKTGDVEHKGMAAVEQLVLSNARYFAGTKVLSDVLESDKLIDLAIARQSGDQKEFDRLMRDIRAEVRDAEYGARQQWGARQQQFTQEHTQQQDVQQTTQHAITASVSQWASRYPALTKDDIAEVTQQLTELGSALVHPATPELAAQVGVKPGDLVIHHDIVDRHLKARATLAARYAEASKKANAVSTENAAKLAAAARGKTGKRPAPSSTRTNADPPKKSNAELWQDQKLRMQSGQFATVDDEG